MEEKKKIDIVTPPTQEEIDAFRKELEDLQAKYGFDIMASLAIQKRNG